MRFVGGVGGTRTSWVYALTPVDWGTSVSAVDDARPGVVYIVTALHEPAKARGNNKREKERMRRREEGGGREREKERSANFARASQPRLYL